jgi:hypothetical protein
MHATDPESVLGDLASGDQQVSELARSRDPFVLVATRGGESSATIAIVTVGLRGGDCYAAAST